MTELLYQTNSYLKDFDAIVTNSFPDGNAISLDRSAFYPGGGGQPNDVGTLNGLPVIKVRKAGDDVLHLIEGDLPPIGTKVPLKP